MNVYKAGKHRSIITHIITQKQIIQYINILVKSKHVRYNT